MGLLSQRERLTRRVPAPASSLTNDPSSFEMFEISTTADDRAAATVRPGRKRPHLAAIDAEMDQGMQR